MSSTNKLLNCIIEETPLEKITLIDPPSRFKSYTEVTTGIPYSPSAVKVLRSKTITVYTVERKPKAPRTLISSRVGAQYYDSICTHSGINKLCRSASGQKWLKDSDIGCTFLALPEELRIGRIAEEHLPHIKATNLLREVPPDTDGTDAARFLWSNPKTAAGRKYLNWLVGNTDLKQLRRRPGGYQKLEKSLIGRIWLWLNNKTLLNGIGPHFYRAGDENFTTPFPIQEEPTNDLWFE